MSVPNIPVPCETNDMQFTKLHCSLPRARGTGERQGAEHKHTHRPGGGAQQTVGRSWEYLSRK